MAFELLAGLDEVGRGALAGPVIAAAVILPEEVDMLSGLTDSKKLTPRKREQLASLICEQAIGYAIGRADPCEIDRMNIHHASLLAMYRAINSLPVTPDRYVVDGKFTLPQISIPGTALVKGDLLIPAVSAASIIAKVYRDYEMQLLGEIYPDYAFDRHKGYPTSLHAQQLEKLGPSPHHRMSYAPVAQHCR